MAGHLIVHNYSSEDRAPEKQFDPEYMKYFMLRIDTNEALALIQSLAEQVKNDNPNAGRLESPINYGHYYGYFSISVFPPKVLVEMQNEYHSPPDSKKTARVTDAGLGREPARLRKARRRKAP